MELSSLNIKKNPYIFSKESFPYIFSKNSFLIFPEMEPCTSHPNPQKNPKKFTRKKFLIFRETELSSSNIKKKSYMLSKESFYYILSKVRFSYISENRTLHFSAQVLRIKKNPSREEFLYFRKRKSRKIFYYISYILEIFYIFFPKFKFFLIFQEGTWKA